MDAFGAGGCMVEIRNIDAYAAGDLRNRYTGLTVSRVRIPARPVRVAMAIIRSLGRLRSNYNRGKKM
jgi:hypothetical protein